MSNQPQNQPINREEWIAEIKEAARKDGWTKEAIADTEWESFYETYADYCTPPEALAEDLTNL